MLFNHPTISIIIPIYNTEKYLRRCLDSIVAQTYKDFECILVDDGSTDDSSKICDEYATKDNRLKVFHNTNGGPSKARNFGIDKARGGYLIFIDSDDWLEHDALATYTDEIKKNNPDIIKTGYSQDSPDGRCEIFHVSKDKYLTSQLDIYYETETDGYAGFLWDTLFKREAIGEERLDENLKWLEDHVFSFAVFSHCHSMSVLSKVTYHYMVNQGASLSDIRDPQLVWDATKREYEEHKKLIGDDAKANYMNTCFLIGNLSLALNVLYANCTYSQRKKFRQENHIGSEITNHSKYAKLFFSPLPMPLADSLTRIYRFLKWSKSTAKRIIKRIIKRS